MVTGRRLLAVLCLALCVGCLLPLYAADGVLLRRQRSFRGTVPAGNYSGIAWLGEDRYAVVSDKSEAEGFFVFSIAIDSVNGDILGVRNLGFVECDKCNRDLEGIAWLPERQMVLISGEADNRIRAYTANGIPADMDIPQAAAHSSLPANGGLESLSYNAVTKSLWTCNETGPVRIAEYDSLFSIKGIYEYPLDAPLKQASKAAYYAHGVSEICADDDGTLLVLEREFYVPKRKIGASVNCKLYRYLPSSGGKQLLGQWKSRLNLLKRNIANYEGMCFGPCLADGSRVVVMVADSQGQYKGVMKDWFRTAVVQ